LKEYRIALVGFGNVGRALLHLLESKQQVLRENYGFTTRITGIATLRHGMAVDPAGIDSASALRIAENNGDLTTLSSTAPPTSVMDFIRKVPADVLFENSPLNYHTGQPAADHLRAALQRGMHAITANKGPVVHAYDDLTRLATENGVRFLFESAVMDRRPHFFSVQRSPPCGRAARFLWHSQFLHQSAARDDGRRKDLHGGGGLRKVDRHHRNRSQRGY